MACYLGIDIGSLSCDAVVIDDHQHVLASSVVLTGARNQEAIAKVQAEVLAQLGLSENDVSAIVSTGYGRSRVENRIAAKTEITCHAKGINAIFPEASLLIDIGGQDSKTIMLDPSGHVMEFAMNDKCAAGTGRFLEAMARALQVDISEMADMDQGASMNLKLSSMCTVFAESEVVSLIAHGQPVNEIVDGLNRSIASRTLSLIKRVARQTNGHTVAMSGGVARNKGVVRAISQALGAEILVPEKPDIVGALGAALIALESTRAQ